MMRTIKRYNNRKLYDTEAKRYITLDGIAELIREGQDVEVIENDTGEDLTAVTLSQIIFEQQKRGSPTPLGFLTSLIRFDDSSPLDLLRRTFALPSTAFNMVEKEIERRLQVLVEQGELAEEQMRRVQADLMARLKDPKEAERRPKEENQTLLSRLNVPTHDDMQDLAERLDLLTERLDELIQASHQQQQAASDLGDPDLPPPPDTQA